MSQDHPRSSARSEPAAEPSAAALSAPPAPPQAGPSLGERAVSGSVITILRFAGEYGMRMVSNLILTRILVPEDFGLMAIVSVLMTGLAMFSDVGLASIVVQNDRGDDPAFLNTVWTVQVARGVVLTALALLLAAPMADFYGDARLYDLVGVACLTAFVGGFNSIALFKLQRHLRVKKLAAIELTGQAFSILVTISWAIASPSVWALVYGGLVGSVGKMVLSHLVAREHRCRFGWDRSSIGELIDFGKWIFLSTVLFFLAGQSDRLIFGRLMDLSVLGVFSIAMIFATIPTQVVWRIGSAVVFPALSRSREANGNLSRVYGRAQMPMLVLGALPVGAMVGVAPDLIDILYDPRYAEAGWMLQLLGLATWVQIPQASSGSLLMAVGQPRWIAIANGVKFLGLLLCLPVGWMLYGTAGAIAGLAGAEVFRYVTLVVAIRGQNLPVVRADMLGTLFFAVVTLGTAQATHGLALAGLGPWLRFPIGLLVAVAIWAPGAAWLLRDEMPRLREGLAARRSRQQGA